MKVLPVKHGHLYLADLSPRMGTEPGKLRPVVIIQNCLLNEIPHPSTWIIPCTTRLTPASILRVRLPKKMAGNNEDCDIMIDQSRTIDNRRFSKLLGHLPSPVLSEVKEKLRLLGEL